MADVRFVGTRQNRLALRANLAMFRTVMSPDLDEMTRDFSQDRQAGPQTGARGHDLNPPISLCD